MGCLGSKNKNKNKNNNNNNNNDQPLENVGKSAKGNDGKQKNVPVASLPNKKNNRRGGGNDISEKEDFAIAGSDVREKYERLEEIGKGNFSVVYRGRDKETGEEFAIKCINKKKVKEEEIRLLRREMKIMNGLDHPFVLKLYEVYENEDEFNLVMELVKGKELFDKIVERGMYSERDAAHVISQVLEAVAYLHENGIAHRDLKPENLLSTEDGENEIVKIADFGFAKNFKREGQVLMTSCGSPGYVAPEILTAECYDESVDLWSIGVIIYILLSGYPPFYADSAPALFKKIMEVNYDFDDSVWDDISDMAKDLIQHLLVKDPSQRFSAQQCLEHPWIRGSASNKKKLKMKQNPDK